MLYLKASHPSNHATQYNSCNTVTTRVVGGHLLKTRGVSKGFKM